MPKTFAVSIECEVPVPAGEAFKLWVGRTFIHPDRIVKKAVPRMVRWKWQDEGETESVVELTFRATKTGAGGCIVRVVHEGLATEETAAIYQLRWDEELEAFASYAALAFEVPVLELAVLPARGRGDA